ncbi:hypothetical protein LCGC14_1166630 [marine sediment metagenome]|uniref:Uncharacterized protein n=1 Tax=marine sediment metagenome TaxID=412755 RepID=A0A0F9GMX6_9ZZZZ
MSVESDLALMLAMKKKRVRNRPLYPGVRQSCPGIRGGGTFAYIPCPVSGYRPGSRPEGRRLPDESKGEYDPCEGRGWVPSLDLTTWMNAVRDAHGYLHVLSHHERKASGWVADTKTNEGSLQDTILLAVLRVAEKASV